MSPLTTSVFDLPDHLTAKADMAFIGADDLRFTAITECLQQSLADESEHLDAARRAPGGTGQEAMDRDMEIHRLTARLRVLGRFGLDLCLGRMVGAADAEPVYVGRIGLADSAGRLRSHPRQPDGSGEPPEIPLDQGPDQRLLGRGLHPGRVGRACHPRRPVRLHRQPGQ